MKYFTLLFITLLLFGCGSNTSNDSIADKADSSSNIVPKKKKDIYDLEQEHSTKTLIDNTLFLGFQFGMTKQEVEAQKNVLLKAGKLKGSDYMFSFVIDEEEPKIYGEGTFISGYNNENVLTNVEYDIVIKKDKALFDKLSKYAKADASIQQDSVVIKDINQSYNHYRKRIRDLFMLKYGKTDEFIGDSKVSAWFNNGREIKIDFVNNNDIRDYSSLYLDNNGSIKIGEVSYRNLKLYDNEFQKRKKEDEVKHKAEEAEKIKKLNL